MRTLAVLVVLIMAGCTGVVEDAAPPLVEPSPDPSALRQAMAEDVAAGRPVTLPATTAGALWATEGHTASRLGLDLTMLLQPSSAFSEAWVRVDGEDGAAPAFDAYEGHLQDQPGSRARIVATDAWIRGIVLTDFAAYTIEVNWTGVALPSNEERGATGSSPELQDPEDACPVLPMGADRFLRPLQAPWDTETTLAGPSAESTLHIDVVLDADGPVWQLLGNQTFAIMAAQAMETDAILSRELGAQIRVVGLHAHREPLEGEGWLDSKLAAYWNEVNTTRDVVHGFGMGQPALGKAFCIGGAGDIRTAYAFTDLRTERGLTTLPYWSRLLPAIVMAHEWGHLYEGLHQYGVGAVNVDGAPAVLPVTIMASGTNGFEDPLFSPVSRMGIRGALEAYDREP